MEFWVYENWQAHGHRATIHLAECGHCQYGQGQHPGSTTKHGTWHGPYESIQAAAMAAGSTGAQVRACRHCRPS